jgi:diadenosine tetraphosphate (Ap4A) HIT family hydrolase
MNTGCPFCRPVYMPLECDLAYVIRDKYQAIAEHLLILPRRHVGDWLEAKTEERIALFDLADVAMVRLDREFHPDGYNLGINVGEAAGQTIFHVYLHLIPRKRGDVPDPLGGVRGVIPCKQTC